ncbi:MAG: cytochrome c biogenesis protein [cyanobacterium endosymbiont of Rhopalodia musculus]|uniref:cytochrome c biogenesis protein n=1 Tax=cyanobacterium endosymbiont of Epithemia clementina EcSB TaxID=3034674 RepID=UPI00247FC7FC|nr:cytochrome c biogenesis protein [cyanobacterium endosymbiont of Epithemia clementina EcSB]WGT68078.1 cytochrome c biogenesis protein [cyanobacterium endosymbiont of Epithemia clementina EcSB]
MNSSNLPQETHFFSLFWQGWQQIVKITANLRLAIILLLVIALFSVSGTVIEQGESLSFYQENYPEDPALFGFLTWNLILNLGLNHVYSTWWFLALLVFLGTSLTACTFTRQFSAFKAARNWRFYQQPRQFQKFALSGNIENISLVNVVNSLRKRGYKVYQNNNSLYARKGIVGRIGPIVVHAAILIILGGAIWGILAGFLAQEMVASGSTFEVENIIEAGPFSKPLIPTNWGIRVNRFWIDYTPNGDINQFYSDLSVVNNQGKELDRKTIFVNEPLRYDGVTFYQTSWGIAGVKVQVNNGPIFQIPIVPLKTEGKGKIWGTWIPTQPDLSEGVSLLAKDLQGTMIVYDNNGNLYSAIRPGMMLDINGATLKVCELIGSTGLQIKADPGIPLVYTGFGLLMLGVIASYVSHSQVWVLQQENRCYIGGKTNRAHVSFEKELVRILDELKNHKVEPQFSKV